MNEIYLSELIEELNKLSSGELVRVFYSACSDREKRNPADGLSVYERFVIAEVDWADRREQPTVRIACDSPSVYFGPDDLDETGRCECCGLELCSAYKAVQCPVCLTENQLT